MTRLPAILIVNAVVCTLATPALAQWVQPLRTERDAGEFCRYSEPARAAAPDETESADHRRDEAYDVGRRNRAQRPVVVWLEPEAAPVIGYDRITGMLEFSLYQPAPFTPQHAVQVTAGTVAIEVAQDEAHRLWARYGAGTARLRLTFLPAAWSDYDRSLCRDVDGVSVIDGDVLAAELVDQVDKRIVGMKTRLGHEVAMMREHRIKGYLDSGMPVVAVSALSPFPRGSVDIDDVTTDQLKSSIRAAVYGCYLRGLTDNARLQGALVVKVRADEEAPTVLVDSLHDVRTSTCVTSRMAELVRGHGRVPDDASLKAAVIFRLEESGSL